ncbi:MULTISPECIES: hypothetical protein [unclassified Aeromonas]|uniref:hypothetical protein n=1 Tax=Aeromonas TaxID=642 RepID=UPI003527CC34
MQPHGKFAMERRGQMLICRPSGAFNLAGAMAYEARFRDVLAELQGGPWGIVEVITEFEAAGPEVLHRFHRQFDWCAGSGCQYLAVVLSGGFKRYLADQVFAGVPFRAVHYCECEQAAITWLEAQLACSPS